MGIIVGKDLQYNNASKKYFTVWDNYKDAKGKQGLLKNPEELNKLVRQIYFVRRSLSVSFCASVSLSVGVPDTVDEGYEGVLCLFCG